MMDVKGRRLSRRGLGVPNIVWVLLVAASFGPGLQIVLRSPVLAQEASTDASLEKEAFEAAKDLGTLEAWEAFLKSFSSGFRADLAKAYIKKLGEGGPAGTQPPPTDAEPAPDNAALPDAEALACREVGKLRSEKSASAAKLVFSNQSDSERRITWIDFRGKEQKSIILAPGQENIQQTFLTHPWLVRDADGKCLQVFRALGEESMARF